MGSEGRSPEAAAGASGRAAAGRAAAERAAAERATAERGTAERGAAGARVADCLANERTFLAWIRTSLALITFGFVIAKFSVWLRQFTAGLAVVQPGLRVPRPGASLPAGLLLMAFGALVAVLALHRHRAVDRALAEGRLPPAARMTLLVTVLVVLVALGLVVFLLATSRALG